MVPAATLVSCIWGVLFAVRTLAEIPISLAKIFEVFLNPNRQIRPRRLWFNGLILIIYNTARRLYFAFFPIRVLLHTIRHNITVSETRGVDKYSRNKISKEGVKTKVQRNFCGPVCASHLRLLLLHACTPRPRRDILRHLYSG